MIKNFRHHKRKKKKSQNFCVYSVCNLVWLSKDVAVVKQSPRACVSHFSCEKICDGILHLKSVKIQHCNTTAFKIYFILKD